MNISWMRLCLFGMLALLLVGGGATGGWLVKGWKDGAADRDAVQAKADAAAKQYLQLNASNEANAKRIATLLVTMEGQARAFAKLDAYLAAHPMGTCKFDPATDRLWTGAYDAAFGPDQAGSGHGQAEAPRPAADQHEPAPQRRAGRPQLQAVPRHD